jgi:hypothetical protein
MKNELLTSYLNISKLLELVPNTNEYIAHRKLMSQNEVEVAKHLKKKHADKKHRILKKLNTHTSGNNSKITTAPPNAEATHLESKSAIVYSDVSDSLEIQPASSSTSRAYTDKTSDGDIAGRSAITHKPQNEPVSTYKCENAITSRQVRDNSEIEVTSSSEAEIETTSNSSEPQVFQMYDDEDEFTDEIDDVINELANDAAEKYHSIMDEHTFQQFLKLQQQEIQLAKKGNDNDEFEMVQSQLTNMMDEADEKEMMNKPIDEVVNIAIRGTLDNIESYLHKDKILKRISELQQLTITTENVDEWMPTFVEITRLKGIPKQSRNRKKNRKKTRR